MAGLLHHGVEVDMAAALTFDKRIEMMGDIVSIDGMADDPAGQ
jgi:hypothetical protein